jgi:hypothetical protein
MVKNQRLVGAPREKAVARAVRLYGQGKAIRVIAEELDRSYGWVHAALVAAGVTLRGRGGNQRGKKKG